MMSHRGVWSSIIVCVVIAVAGFYFFSTESNFHIVNFSQSMGGPDFREYQLMMKHEDDARCCKVYEQLFYKNMQAAKKKNTISKIIHQIWLGPSPLPSFFLEYQRSWLEKHPDWEYKLWTDVNVKDFPMELRREFEASKNYGEKSDILRAEILDVMGGIYVDVDIECLRSFDALVNRCDFFAGIEPPHIGENPKSDPRLIVSNALIGSCPGHPFIKEWKRLVRSRWLQVEREISDGKLRVLHRTFYTFSEAVSLLSQQQYDHQDLQYCNIILPATYFYPLTFSEVHRGGKKQRNIFKKTVRSFLYFCGLRKRPCFSQILPETMAIHYWSGTWAPSQKDRLSDRKIAYIESMSQCQDELLSTIH